MKYILVTGGVISGIGKGIISSSIGTILRSHGYRVTSIKVFKKIINSEKMKSFF
jgi:CTP synthase